MQGVEECNMFREDGKVIHFGAPKGKNHLRSPSPKVPRDGKDLAKRTLVAFCFFYKESIKRAATKEILSMRMRLLQTTN